ncbi:MAG: ribosome maturation factor RimM [Lachnospiraceae bacterium]|nr:ribosome maturation factor RimM [Lachnospiraceae bacterium]MDD7078136.1 ribosome maturation factor RimM [Lachnospiraceae bacterium]MDY3730728.1 ribosome maturation factor RimM [Candidatus Choladocola sp.]
MQDILQVGAVTNTHGIAGEVKVFPTTDDPKRFKKLKHVLVDSGNGMKELEITGVKFFKNMVILKFKGLDRIEDVMAYKGKNLYVTRENAVKLKKNEYFIADLVGMDVFTEDGERLGSLRNVIQTGANDVYEVAMENGKDVLIPAIRQCIIDVNVEEAKMTVHLLEGLLE